MAYFVEHHDSTEWETNEVFTLYMEEWSSEKLLGWFEDTFWYLERAGVTIAEVLEDDPIIHGAGPPESKFFSWAPFEDERTVNIWSV